MCPMSKILRLFQVTVTTDRFDGSYLSAHPEEYDRLEKHLEKNHFELSDLESRRAFAYLKLADETKMVLDASGN